MVWFLAQAYCNRRKISHGFARILTDFKTEKSIRDDLRKSVAALWSEMLPVL